MSEEPNTYEYVVKKQALLNVDGLSQRIVELESANAFLKEQNDSLAFLSKRVSDVMSSQRISDIVGFVNTYLLDNGLTLELSDPSPEDYLIFTIEDAEVRDGVLSPRTNNYTVTGHITFEWTVDVSAGDEDSAQEIAERAIENTSCTFYHERDDDVVSCDIDDYSPLIDTSDVFEN